MKIKVLIFFILFYTSCNREEIDVPINADFTYEVIDDDYSIPVKIAFVNKSTGAQTYTWTFEGGSPETYTQKDPGYIVFSKPGNIKVKLIVANDFERKEKEITILFDSTVQADFNITPVINNYGTTEYAILNNSTGSTKFIWTFVGGIPATSIERAPMVKYENVGDYEVALEVSNERGEKSITKKKVTVLPALSADFHIVPSFDDDDYEVPFAASLQNHTTSATKHKWSVSGGVINNPTDSLTSVTFTNPGTYTINYEASNGKQSAMVSKTVTVKPNSGLRTFSDVQLGINTAHNVIGSFFSTGLRKVIKQSEVNSENGDKIDLVFFGLSESFSFNLFASPDAATGWTFAPIPGATQTSFINRLEACG